MKKLMIHTKASDYPLLIGTDIIGKLPEFLQEVGISKENQLFIVSDTNVAPLYLDEVLKGLPDFNVNYYIVEAGETAKALQEAEKIIEFAIKKGLDRTSAIVALGGGVVGDLAGFVASIYMRGIAFVQCPTTILAHDSSVGGKVGINHALGKNLIGSFYQPKLVCYHTSFIKSLPERDRKAGLAEVIKHGLIADASFVDWLDEHADKLLTLDLEYLNDALEKGIKIKAKVVQEDEKEQGIRAILNYGHTLGHAIENLSNYQYLHGESVAIGMAFASALSHKLGLASEHVVQMTIQLIKKYGLPTTIPKEYETNEIVRIMMRDKKFKNNQIRMVLPIDIGKVMIYEDIDKGVLYNVIDSLKDN